MKPNALLIRLPRALWSVDLFRCESATLRTHWILVVMGQFTRRILGFGVHAGSVDGVALCRMFNHALRGQRQGPKYLSSDHDPLYRFERWQAKGPAGSLLQVIILRAGSVDRSERDRSVVSVRMVCQ